MKPFLFFASFPIIVLLSACDPAPADTVTGSDWPHWLGASRNGQTAADSGWDAGLWPPQPVWEANAGAGGTSPVVADGNVFVTGWAGGKETLFCLDLATGEERWRQSAPAPEYGRHAIGDKNFYKGPSATPEFDESTGYIYTLGIDGDLICRDTNKQGKEVWSLNLYEQFGIPQRPQVTKRGGSHRDYGFTSAPFVFRNEVIVEAGDPKRGNLLFFDKAGGKFLRGSENKAPAGHTGGPAPMVIEGVPCLAVLTATHLVVTRLDTAKTVAEYPWATDFINNIPTPAVSGSEVIITSRYNKRAMCKLSVSLRGGAEKVWEIRSASGVCSPVIYKGHVYWSGNGIHCVDLETGEERWTGGKTGEPGSCVITGDGRMVVWANDGDLFLTETAPDGFKLLHGQKGVLNNMAWPHVVIAGKRILCKDRGGRLTCLEPGKKVEPKVATASTFDKEKSLVLGWEKPGGKRGLSGKATKTGRYAWSDYEHGGYVLAGNTAKIADALKATHELTLDVVFTVADLQQTGPARIVTFSDGGYLRNFSLCQEKDTLVFRLRTTATGDNGKNPETTVARIEAGKTYDCRITYREGELACFLNGREVYRKKGHVTGDFSNWTPQHLLIANEWADPRPWNGEVESFALYDRCAE